MQRALVALEAAAKAGGAAGAVACVMGSCEVTKMRSSETMAALWPVFGKGTRHFTFLPVAPLKWIEELKKLKLEKTAKHSSCFVTRSHKYRHHCFSCCDTVCMHVCTYVCKYGLLRPLTSKLAECRSVLMDEHHCPFHLMSG